MEGFVESAGHAIQKAAGSFLSKLKNTFRTSQGAVDHVVTGVNYLTDLHLDFVKEHLSLKLAMYDGHLSLASIYECLETIRGQSLFQGVQTQPYLDSYVSFKSSDNPFGLTQVVFDSKNVFRRGIAHSVPTDFAYFPPFLPQLEQLLNCKDVLHCVENPRPSEEGVFRSVTDGYAYRCHRVVLQHGLQVLSIILYVDDVEFADPCKSKTKKHKMRLYYWTLGNIYPELRSSLKSINLLAIVRYEVAKKYGNEEILKYFMRDMNALANGVYLTVNKVRRLIYGILQFVAADMPAAANLAGLKESHFALRPCRVCMCTRFELCDHFREVEMVLRNMATHEKFVAEVEAKSIGKSSVSLVNVPLNVEAEHDTVDVDDEEDFVQDEGIKFTDHPDPSVNYGINGRSVLSSVPGFDITKCLPFDILHTIFEGCAELLCRLLLKEMCSKPKLPDQPQDSSQPKRKRRKKSKEEVAAGKPKVPLSFVNKFIQESCDFGHLHVSKPSPIERSHLKKKLKQSASQMIVLIHILPFIALNNVSEEKMDLLGLLIQIISQGMKFEVCIENMDAMDALIVTFGENFIKIYPEYKTIKLHSLAHLKMQIYLHGPLRQQACFRFEAMHREFTRLVDIINNMKNLEFSLACRHLSARNADIMNGREDGTFLYPGDTIKKSAPIILSSLPEETVLLEALPNLDPSVLVATVESFVQHGRAWSKDVIVSLNEHTGDPRFGIIVKIFLIEEEIVFLYNDLKVNYFSKFHAFEIQRRYNVDKCIKLSQLKLLFPIARFNIHFGPNRMKSYLVSGSSGNILA